MPAIFDQQAPKKAVNVTINSSLLNAARKRGINLSATLESALTEQVRQTQRQRWREQNHEAIASYNNLVEDGVFSDGRRTF